MTQEQIIEYCSNPTFEQLSERYDIARQTMHQYISNKICDNSVCCEIYIDVVLDDGQGLSEAEKARARKVSLDPTYGGLWITDDCGFTYDLSDEPDEVSFKVAQYLHNIYD